MRTNFITVTFKTRKENIDIYEMEEFNDVLIIEYGDFQTAQAYLNEFMGNGRQCWSKIINRNID